MYIPEPITIPRPPNFNYRDLGYLESLMYHGTVLIYNDTVSQAARFRTSLSMVRSYGMGYYEGNVQGTLSQ